MQSKKNIIDLKEHDISYKMYLPYKDTDYIQKKIAQDKHPYELEMLESMYAQIQDGVTIIDVGANVGNHTLYLAAVRNCQVIAFEPNKALCGAIQSSIKINGFEKKIRLNQLAVGSKKGYGKLANLDENNLGAQSVELVSEEESEFEITTLDSFEWKEAVSAIKIDVEGMEYDVLLGAKQLITAQKPKLYVECQYIENYEKVEQLLEELGYLTVDTFNATPTHLFIHTSQLTADQKLEISLRKSTINEYKKADAISSLRIKLNEANLKYREATKNVDVLKLRLEEANAKYRQSNGQLEHLKAESQNKKQQVANLENEVSALSIEIESVNNEQFKLSKKFQQEIEELRSNLENKKHELSEANTKTIRLDTIVEKLEKDLLQRQQHIYELEQKYQAINKELSVTKTAELVALAKLENLQAQEQTLAKKLDTLDKEYKQLKEHFIAVKASEQAGNATRDLLTNQLTDLKQERASLHTEYQAYQAKSEALIKEITVTAQDYEKRLIQSQTQIENLNAAVFELKQALEQKQTYYETKASELVREKEQLKETLNLAIDDSKKLTHDFESQVGELRASFNVALSNSEKAKREVEGKTKQIEGLVLKIKSLEENLSRSNEELANELTLVADLKQLNQNVTSRVDHLNIELQSARDKYRSVTRQFADAQQRLDSQQDLMNALEKDKVQLENSLKKQLLQLKQEIANSQRQIEKLEYQKQAAEEKVVRTRNYISFRLGYAILEARKSFKGLFLLPYTLWKLAKETKLRKKNNPSNKTSAYVQHNYQASTLTPLLKTLESRTPINKQPGLVNLFADLQNLKVACIMDEFTYTSFAPTCNLFQLTPHNWQQELESFKPKVVFIESAWRGKDELWGNKVGHCSQEVQSIVAWANKYKTPTIFWNKEDPIHFETFLNTARLFDYVFTTDMDCIHRYKEALGHDNIYFLPFAAQPLHSKPIEKYDRKDAFCFAGAYYARYPERTRDLGNFVTQLAEYRPVEIYDRNYGKDDPNYQFPAEYQPYIVGNLPFEEIDKAYKGYRYAINLNSIKQSQTMFARRVYELLASNTITVSNFSRGVRLMFGDLVVVSDSGEEVLTRIEAINESPQKRNKFKLAALRKIMLEHTYQDRLAYVISKVQGHSVPNWQPLVAVTSHAKNLEQFEAILSNYRRQTYQNKTLCVVVPSKADFMSELEDSNIIVRQAPELNDLTMQDWLFGADWVGGMVPDDYYGPNYLLDLALATRYSEAEVITKATHYILSPNQGLTLAWENKQYKFVQRAAVRSSIFKLEKAANENARDWLSALYTKELTPSSAYKALAIDEFNYCKNAAAKIDTTVEAHINDLPGLNIGVSIHELLDKAEQIQPAEVAEDRYPVWGGAKLSELFVRPKHNKVELSLNMYGLHVKSHLKDGKNEYLYAIQDFTPQELGYTTQAPFFLDVTPGLNIQLTILFLDVHKQRISHVIKHANRNQDAEIPLGTEYIRFGLRVYGGGEADVKGLVLGHRPLIPGEVMGQSEQLLLTNHYPSYDDLYRNGFVHSRVVAYKEQGVNVDIYRLRKDEALSYHEYKNIDVMTGSQQALYKLIKNGKYKSILVHFLDEEMWEVLKHHIDRIKVFVWVHGAEIQPWHRRAFNYKTEDALNDAKKKSDVRMAFWRSLLKPMSENLSLVFVSQYAADITMEDMGFRLPVNKYRIIHNPINTDTFNYVPKPVEQRKKILSIRPYASQIYANDLSVQTILHLADKPWFNELEFRMIGDGPLFDEILEPVKGFENVKIERRFLTQPEIASLHKQYGIFLCPSRMDTQGVSRDEAMASGLVPITNAVAAIPEFVDDSCGILATGEDSASMAEGLEKLYFDAQLFQNMSNAAAERVRRQSGHLIVIEQELELIRR